MKRIFVAALAAAGFGLSVNAVAQEHWTEGPVWSCTYIAVSGENWDKYMLYLRRNTLPLINAQKQAGLVLDWKTFVKPQSSPSDWNWASCTQFKSYGEAMDFNAADDAKLKGIAAAHWKTQDEEAQRKAASERFALRKVVSTQLMRQINFRPAP